MEDVGERTEAATPRRRSQAQSRGQFAQSRDLTSALILLAALIAFQNYGESIIAWAIHLMRWSLAHPWIDLDQAAVRLRLSQIAIVTAQALWVWVAIVYGSSLIVVYLQTGGVKIANEKDYFDLGRLDPVKGLGRIFSRKSLVRTSLDVAKVSVIGYLAYLYISDRLPAIAMLTRMPFPEVAAFTLTETLTFAYYAIAVLLALGVVDYLYQRFQYEADMKMTQQQVKEETRDLEGDPAIRARRRQIQLQLARQRMMKELPEAEVVITNPTELAVALKYKVEEMDAPVVVAMGAGVFARRIRELAKEYKIPIIENRPLAQLLFHQAEVGRVIPEGTFIAVAEILAYVYQITRKPVPPRPK